MSAEEITKLTTVKMQIECDPTLGRAVAHVRSHLRALCLEADLDHLLSLWDQSTSSSNFELVAAQHPILIRGCLSELLKSSRSEAEAQQKSDFWQTFVSAFARPSGTRANRSDIKAAYDASGSLAGILDEMQRFTDRKSFVIKTTPTEWMLEHCDMEEYNGRQHILLRDYIFELEAFLSAALHMKWHLSRSDLAAGQCP